MSFADRVSQDSFIIFTANVDVHGADARELFDSKDSSSKLAHVS